MTTGNIVSAFDSLRSRLGPERVLEAVAATDRYGRGTFAARRSILGAVLVRNVDEVRSVLGTAQRYGLPIYPVSTGNNWGYGSANPVLDNCVVVDLSGMKSIVEFNAELGLVTLEPGVTQRDLGEYLDHNAPGYMVPTTGAGPNCSLIGNALERGYGITPYADHFGAVTALEAVLPDGRLYRSALTELGGATVDQAFKWGLGPYLDGLFAQGNLGVVTRMTIALAPRPERTEVFFFGLAEDASLEKAVTAIRHILRSVGGSVGSINLMNARRVLAMTVPYPAASVGPEGIISQRDVLELARQHQIRAWMGVGTIYGNVRVVKAVHRSVRQSLKSVADKIVFLTPERSAFLNRLFHALPGLKGSRTARLVETIDRSMDIMIGRPSEVALPLAYWRSGTSAPRSDLNPARDRCGLIWYPPLVPMTPSAVREYVDMVHEVCGRHGMEPLITLTSLSDRCFDSSVPLLFDLGDVSQSANASACFDALFEAGRDKGFLPYRLGIHAMGRATGTASTYWDLVTAVKSAVDPGNIIAPGRYAPVSPVQASYDTTDAGS